jgi:hypothetical protein
MVSPKEVLFLALMYVYALDTADLDEALDVAYGECGGEVRGGAHYALFVAAGGNAHKYCDDGSTDRTALLISRAIELIEAQEVAQ